MKCPECGAKMVLRSSKYTDGLFWGCSTYPKCRRTVRYVEEEETVLQNMFVPTLEQQDIFDHIRRGKSNLIVNAVAGSGKTTTIVQALGLLDPNKSATFLAFNKSIAETLKRKAPTHVEVRTLHSLGLSFLRRDASIELQQDKYERLLQGILSEDEYKAFGSLVIKVYSLLNSELAAPLPSVTERIMEHFNIESEHLDAHSISKFAYLLDAASSKAIEQSGIVSFDELITIPARNSAICKTFDYVFVDECQDLNMAQIQFIMNCTGPDSVTVCVGDRNQSIYGFRGANSEAMDYMKAALYAEELPLTTCFRCPVSHLKLAQNIVPQISPRKDAPNGDVFNISRSEFFDKVAEEDLVISRLNAPLLPLAFHLIQQGKRAAVKGRDIGQSIISLLQKEKGKSAEEAVSHLISSANKKVERLIKQNKTAQAAYVLDLCDCAIFFIDQYETVEGAIPAVSELFRDDIAGIVLSSIHKAKGLEATRVFIINYHKMPLNVKSSWERQQEQNIMYVSLTRAKQTLYMVRLPEA